MLLLLRCMQVRWLLDHLKLYEFTGVQIKAIIGSTTYLTPAPLPAAASTTSASEGGVLAGHRKSLKRYLGPVVAAAAAAPPGAEQDIRSALKSLRAVVQEGLEGRRAKLTSDTAYQDWHYRNKV